MNEFDEAIVEYHRNEIAHLEQKKFEYEHKIKFYTEQLNITCDEIVKSLRLIRSIEDNVKH